MDDEILTVADVAAELHCSKAHVLNAISGKLKNVTPLPSVSVGRRKLVRRAALAAWLRANERAGDGVILQSGIDSVGA
jgi:hypothetical protein